MPSAQSLVIGLLSVLIFEGICTTVQAQDAPPELEDVTQTVTLKRVQDSTTASLSVDVTKFAEGGSKYTNSHLTVRRDGQVVHSQALAEVTDREKLEVSWIIAARYADDSTHDGFVLRDLDNDGYPEVVLELYSGGAHCCSTSLIYSGKNYEVFTQYWGDGEGPKFQDLDGNGTVELVYRDTRFAYAFTGYAGSGMPLRVWNYRLGQMVDTTRQHQKATYDDAFFWWNRFQIAKRDSNNWTGQRDDYGKGILAAYVADKYLLGQGKDGWQRALQLYEGSDKAEFFHDLKTFLQKSGYSGTKL